MTREFRAAEQRAALGRRIRAYRQALDLRIIDVARHLGTGKGQVTVVERGGTDVLSGTLIEVAEAVGLNVALAADHHLPLLDLTAAEVRAIRWALHQGRTSLGPAGLAARAKLTPEGDTTA